MIRFRHNQIRIEQMPDVFENKFFDESDPDVFLMLEFQKGDRASFENLMRKYYKRVLNFIYRLTGNVETAEDLTQDVFLKVYKAAAQYHPKSKFQTWLYTIAKNAALNELRRRKRPVMSLDAEMSSGGETFLQQTADENAQNPSDELLTEERARAVREAVLSLPDHQRAVVVLYRYERMSYEQIARTMGMSVSAVKSLLSRARGNLRQRLSRFILSPEGS